MDSATYDQYMTFNIKEPNPWTEEHLNHLLRNITASKKAATDNVETIRFCYEQSPQKRSYHGPDHAVFVGQEDAPETLLTQLSDNFSKEKATAILALSGLFHDVAYKHVDALDNNGTRAWPSVLSELIGTYAKYTTTVENGKVIYRTHLTEEGKSDAVTKLVAHIFEVNDNGIIHNQGGNEFDSALAAAKFLQAKGASPKMIMATVGAIAATVPFKPGAGYNSDIKDGAPRLIDDGHMGELAKRIKSSDLNGYTPDWQDVNDMMLLNVHLANRDISQFIQKNNFPEMIAGGRAVRKEEVPEFRAEFDNANTIQDLAQAAKRERSAPFLYQSLGGEMKMVPPENVPHLYIPRNNQGEIDFDTDKNGNLQSNVKSYPPVEVYEQAVRNTQKNASMCSTFFKAHEAGIALAASIATAIGEPDAKVPGIVDAKLWHSKAIPQLINGIPPFTEEEKIIYNELLNGQAQKDIDGLVSARSPIAGNIFGALGFKKMEELSKSITEIYKRAAEQGIENPFSNPEIAQNYIETVKNAIGQDNFQIITTELHRVAKFYTGYHNHDPERGNKERMPKLEELGNGLKEYASRERAR